MLSVPVFYSSQVLMHCGENIEPRDPEQSWKITSGRGAIPNVFYLRCGKEAMDSSRPVIVFPDDLAQAID